jgi:hypothetical protein
MEAKFSKTKSDFDEISKTGSLFSLLSLPVNGAIFILIIFGPARSKYFLFSPFVLDFRISPHLLLLRPLACCCFSFQFLCYGKK